MAKIALLVGVSDYELGLTSLPSALKDVEAMSRVLSPPDMGAFDQVSVLQNPDPLAMQIEIQKAFASNRHKNDLVLFFFSGHGIRDERGNLYLATRMTRKTEGGELLKATAVPAQFIHNIMNDCRSRRQVVVLDCCFSGAFAEGLLAKDDASVDIKSQLGGEGRAILTSSTSTQYSFEQKDAELSIYTRYLVEGIESGAADSDRDGMVAVEELHEYAKEKVQEAAPAMKPEIYAIKEGYKILLAKVPLSNPQSIYRQEVERLASRGEISLVGRLVLDEKRQQLGISLEEADVIEQEVLKPYRDYQEKLQRYQKTLAEIKERDRMPNELTISELKQFQQVLGLKAEDVAPIEARFIPPPEPVVSSSPPESKPETSLPLDPAFLNHCQQELARYIGPMANFILKDTLAHHAQLSPKQLIEVLATEIPNSQQAQTFTKHCLDFRF
jgi:uncharacterized caspase-like protein